MPVTLDAPPGQPMWRVQCEKDCGRRLYLYGVSAYDAARRARQEYGWEGDENEIVCREHSRG